MFFKNKGLLVFPICLLMIVLASNSAYSQEEYRSLTGNNRVKVSGFGGPLMSFTSIGDDFAHMMGGGGGLIVGNFFFGGYGMGQTITIPYPGGNPDEDFLQYGHGGLWFGFIIAPNAAIHPTFHVQCGWGSISKKTKLDIGSADKHDIEDYNLSNRDAIYVVNPTFELEANVSKFFKIGAGANYSFVYGVQSMKQTDFWKPGVFLSFKFGWFA